MEDKKKKNTKKTTKKETTKKTAVKKTTTKKAKPETKKEVVKKVEPKKNAKKVNKKKKLTKKDLIEQTYTFSKEEQARLKKEINKLTKKDLESLEKTYIFNEEEITNLNEVLTKLNSDKSDEEIERSPLNKGLIAFLTLSILGVVIFCIIYSINQTVNEPSIIDGEDITRNIQVEDKTSKDDSNINEIYEDLDYSNIINTTIDDFEVKIAEGKNMLVLISSQTCYYCITFEPIINSVLVEEKDEAIRLNITRMTEEETKRLRTYYAFTSAPTLLVIRDGKVKAEAAGSMTKEEFSNWYKENVK